MRAQVLAVLAVAVEAAAAQMQAEQLQVQVQVQPGALTVQPAERLISTRKAHLQLGRLRLLRQPMLLTPLQGAAALRLVLRLACRLLRAQQGLGPAVLPHPERMGDRRCWRPRITLRAPLELQGGALQALQELSDQQGKV